MILIDYFTEACCKGTELIEGWYWYEDGEEHGRCSDGTMLPHGAYGEAVGGPFEDEEDAILASELGITWADYEQ